MLVKASKKRKLRLLVLKRDLSLGNLPAFNHIVTHLDFFRCIKLTNVTRRGTTGRGGEVRGKLQLEETGVIDDAFKKRLNTQNKLD